MKKLYVLLLLPIIISSCGQKTELPKDLKPTYAEFKNIWQERNLYGKVKEIESYKTVYQKDKEDNKAVLTLKEHFTDFGALKEASYYDGSGELIENNILDYDKADFNFKTTTETKSGGISFTSKRQKDSVNNSETNRILGNDKLVTEAKFFFNAKGKVVKQVTIANNDTAVTRTDYKLDKAGKVISETAIAENKVDPISIRTYKYDEKGHITKSSFKTLFQTITIKTEWKNDRIYKNTEYIAGQDLKMHLSKATEFDSLYNPIAVEFYQDSKLASELKYSYEFDKNGNWIKRDAARKDNLGDSKKFEPAYKETREIKYW